VGKVEAARSSELGFELAGTVRALTVDEGQRVEAGQLLGELDTARLEAQKNELEAALEEARASRRLAAVTFERAGRLEKSGAVSKQRLDEAKRQIDSAEAAVALIEAQKASVEVNFTKSQLRAPYAGIVAERRADEGSVLNAGMPVFRILESEHLEVRAGLAPSAASELSVGQEVELSDSMGRHLVSKVDRILPGRDETTRTVDVILLVEDENSSLRDGDLIQVILRREIREEGFWVPRTSLTESVRGLWAAYVLVPDERDGVFAAERRQIEIMYQTGDRLFVRGALRDGEQVVVDGLQRVVPGQRVRPGSAESAARN